MANDEEGLQSAGAGGCFCAGGSLGGGFWSIPSRPVSVLFPGTMGVVAATSDCISALLPP